MQILSTEHGNWFQKITRDPKRASVLGVVFQKGYWVPVSEEITAANPREGAARDQVFFSVKTVLFWQTPDRTGTSSSSTLERQPSLWGPFLVSAPENVLWSVHLTCRQFTEKAASLQTKYHQIQRLLRQTHSSSLFVNNQMRRKNTVVRFFCHSIQLQVKNAERDPKIWHKKGQNFVQGTCTRTACAWRPLCLSQSRENFMKQVSESHKHKENRWPCAVWLIHKDWKARYIFLAQNMLPFSQVVTKNTLWTKMGWVGGLFRHRSLETDDSRQSKVVAITPTSVWKCPHQDPFRIKWAQTRLFVVGCKQSRPVRPCDPWLCGKLRISVTQKGKNKYRIVFQLLLLNFQKSIHSDTGREIWAPLMLLLQMGDLNARMTCSLRKLSLCSLFQFHIGTGKVRGR